jgi:hypothetical protein
MLTLKALWHWVKWTGLAVLAFVIAHAVIATVWWLVLATLGIALVWVTITLGLFFEWRARGAGYRAGGPERRL